ncbi:hypothetical protein L873DRAFT_1263851 [Choiromyces venosus 120613-1]|uniref:Uncharacterized protein n=1 Tax=Choiromyces venosus 120613-1 TaxID=1336337 RepID=A0A3N4JQJ9_9PEZI|nr:hypothetical protein L873DRAFT_1263851 [Choiromyces venosus 120613-1]
MPSRKDLLLRLEQLESTYEGHKKANEEQKKATEENREIIEEQKEKGLKRTNKELQDLRGNFRVMDTTVVPIVAAVVLKSFYKKGLRLVQMRNHVPGTRADIICRDQDRFNEFGLAISERCLIL